MARRVLTADTMHLRRSAPTLAALAVCLASCHAAYHPSEIADSCGCGRDQYCRIHTAGSSEATECLPIPAKCSDPPTCACLGRPVDACREELGRFWVFERRAVAACDACSSEEYCMTAAAGHQCALLPPQCEDESTCACFTRVRRSAEVFSCDDRSGRIEVSQLSPR